MLEKHNQELQDTIIELINELYEQSEKFTEMIKEKSEDFGKLLGHMQEHKRKSDENMEKQDGSFTMSANGVGS